MMMILGMGEEGAGLCGRICRFLMLRFCFVLVSNTSLSISISISISVVDICI